MRFEKKPPEVILETFNDIVVIDEEGETVVVSTQYMQRDDLSSPFSISKAIELPFILIRTDMLDRKKHIIHAWSNSAEEMNMIKEQVVMKFPHEKFVLEKVTSSTGNVIEFRFFVTEK